MLASPATRTPPHGRRTDGGDAPDMKSGKKKRKLGQKKTQTTKNRQRKNPQKRVSKIERVRVG
jgi:hypothetical protein